MDFRYPPEAEAFRQEFRSWLDDTLTDEWRALTYRGEPDAEWIEAMRSWNRTLAAAGYAAISWPVEHGGRDASVMEQVVFAEECQRARTPAALNQIGLSNIAPSIMAFGTEQQKKQFLQPMLRGDEIWSQGFSEPNAGSDLAALGASAAWNGEGWTVNGQKVWNTGGQFATWCELLVRTDPSARKHDGITCLLVDMALPGIDVRPLRSATGDHEFSEIFMTDVHVPADALLGEANQGWTVAMATLSFERGGVAKLHLGARAQIADLIAKARAGGVTGDGLVRQRLARLYSDGELLRLLSDRAISRAAAGLPPGPESSLIKIVWSQVCLALPLVAADVLGVEVLNGSGPMSLMSSRAASIAGGTTEVNKNIVGERVLGLPREPKA